MNSLLIVDDDLEVLDLLKKFFVQHGYSVEVATDGASLWAAIERQAPDLIILDVMLPGLNGWQLLQQIRQLGATPILFLTTKDGIEDRLRGLELHEDDYLLKPFTHSALVARVRKLLRRDRGR